MGDIGQAKLEDSNMANYGGKEMRDQRKAAAQSDPEFKNLGTKVGMEIWRVENRRTENDTPDFGVKRWPKDQYGSFYSGDSYILLNTFHPKDPETGKVQKDKLAWDVHFWLGESTSIDEQGVAAYKTVEIDDILDDAAIQHREVQYNESSRFQGYFPTIQYMEGGIESGFRKVKPEEYEPRLLQVRRTKKTVRAIPVECKATAMNHGDVFILDAGTKVYAWVGAQANAFEKAKGVYVQSNIVNSRNGKAKKMKEIDDDFWQILGGSEGDVQSAEAADKTPEPTLDTESLSLFKLSDSTGKLTFTTVVEGGPIKKDQLDSADVFIIASGIGLFAWVGSGASDAERRNAIISAGKWLADSDLPNTLPITRIVEDQPADVLFESLFSK